MAKPELAPEEAVSRYREALLRGASPEEAVTLAAALDPGIVRLIDLFWEARQHDPQQPRPEFARQLERDLLDTFATARPAMPVLRPGVSQSVNGHVPFPIAAPVAPAAPQAWQGRGWLPLAAAAVLAILLVGGLLVRFALPRAPETTLVAGEQPQFETLVDATVEGAANVYTPISVERWSFQPGGATLTVPPLDGSQWIVAEQSTVIAAVNGKPQSLAAGQSLIVPAGQELQLRDEGLMPASVLRGVASSSFSLEQFDRNAISKQTALDSQAHEALPPGASRVLFERITLPPGATLLTEPATGQDWIAVDRGRLGLTLMGDGVPTGWSSGQEREVAAGDRLPALVPGTQVSLRNIGDEPLVLLRLHVTALGIEETSTPIQEARP